jgi:histidine ammonia-lyase
MCGAQALEGRRPLTSSPPIEDVVRRIRALVPRLEADRVVAPDIATLADAIGTGRFIA